MLPVFAMPKNTAPPAKKSKRGRPKRDRILSETVYRMRQERKSLRQIQEWLSASLVAQDKPPLQDSGDPEHPYYRAARRWVESSEKSLESFQTLTDEREILQAAALRAMEALALLDEIAEGRIPLIDSDGKVIPKKSG
jgi:hypothetical protein